MDGDRSQKMTVGEGKELTTKGHQLMEMFNILIAKPQRAPKICAFYCM